MTEHIDKLRSLHTALIDSRNGYKEALKDADQHGLTSLFSEMITLRTAHSEALAEELTDLGERVDERGSFMSTVHRAVISMRALFGGLDRSVLPGLIDGEERIIGYYDDAILASPQGVSETILMIEQRDVLRRKIGEMRARVSKAA
jgi:uncharacterized protein (TIGR02284 family)